MKMKAKGAAPVKAAVAPPTTTTVVTTTPNPPTSSAAPNPFMQMVGPFFGADGGVTQGTPVGVACKACYVINTVSFERCTEVRQRPFSGDGFGAPL
jgi:hypothetical protein